MQKMVLLRAGGFALTMLWAAARPTHGQAPSPVSWSIRAPEVSALSAGTTALVTLTASVAPGWHIYSLSQKPGGPIALRISVPVDGPFVLDGNVSGPKPEVRADATLGIPIELHSGATDFTVPLKVTLGTSGRELEGRISARFPACTDTICLPPRNVSVPVRLQQRTNGPGR